MRENTQTAPLPNLERSWFKPVLGYSNRWIGLGLTVLSLSPSIATNFKETFSSHPDLRGWQVKGRTELFTWNEVQQSLQVTWDSSHPNSFFYLPLPFILTEKSDFSFSFDLVLDEVRAGISVEKPSTFEIAFGLFHQEHAFGPNYIRGTGRHTPNLVEWNYFPDADPITPTVTAAVISDLNQFVTDGFVNQIEMLPRVLYHISAVFQTRDRILTLNMTADGQSFGQSAHVVLPKQFAGFTIDAFGITSYSDDGQPSPYAGSIFAQGKLDNLELRITPVRPKIQMVRINSETSQVSFLAEPGEHYVIESSTDLNQWRELDTFTSDHFQRYIWMIPVQTGSICFYRIAVKP